MESFVCKVNQFRHNVVFVSSKEQFKESLDGKKNKLHGAEKESQTLSLSVLSFLKF